jgi:hypothetical protein
METVAMLLRTSSRPALSVIGILALVIAAAACASTTTLEQGWITPTAQNQLPLKKVVTVFSSKVVTMRRAAEEQMAHGLAAKGVVATPGYTVLTDQEATALANLTGPPTGELAELTARLRKLGYDGIITMRIVDREVNLYSGPGSHWAYGYGYPYAWGPGYYSPGYVSSETVYRTEAKAYSLVTDQLIWSGLTKTVDPANTFQLFHSTSKTVAGELTKRGLAG